MQAAVINPETNIVDNVIVIGALEPSYGMKLAWITNGYGIGDIWISTDPVTGIGTFEHPSEG